MNSLLPPRFVNGKPVNDTLSQVYTKPKASFLRRYGGRIAGGLACAFTVSLVMHLGVVVEGIRWVGEVIRWTLGKPAAIKVIKEFPDRPKVKERIKVAVEQGKEILREHKPPVVKAIPKLAPEIGVIRETAKRIEAVEQKVGEVAKGEQKIAVAIKGTGDKAKGIGDRVAKALHDRKEAKDQAKYDQLVVRARKIGLKVDDSWTLARLEAEVQAAEEARWRNRWNAQCPFCRYRTRINKARKWEQYRCLNCKHIYSAATALALGAPPKQGGRFPW